MRPLAAQEEDKPQPPQFEHLKFRLIGPYAGGRVARVAGVPNDPWTYYVASAAGGVWKSTDGGQRWNPVFDKQPVSSIGSIAVAASAPSIVYVGSGEANIRGNVAAGNGIYKSVDGGKTWKHVWKQEGQIGTMLVHPSNPDTAFAAVLGHAFGPNPERGVYRTRDGGKTWERVLFKDQDTGASDVCFDPSNPNKMFAGLWQVRRRPWELVSGGPGSGLYTSDDGGDTWKEIKPDEENGLPPKPWGKIGVAVAPSDNDRVYALIEAEKGGLFRSDDGGKKWKRTTNDRKIRQRAWYYSTLTIDPQNADIVYCPQVPMLRSTDGGATFNVVPNMYHGDNHDIWIDPQNPKRMIVGNDGGVNITNNGGESWHAPQLPISQFYHVNVDNRTPYFVSGAMQDLGTACGPSNSLNSLGIRLSDWYSVGGGEAGYTVHDFSDPNIIYAGEYAGIITRYDHRTQTARNISVFPDNPSGHGAEEMKYRFRWPAPIAMSPHDAKTIYHGGNVLFKTNNGGQTWTAISGDLTRNDKSKQKFSGGPITGDNTTAEYYCCLSAVVESAKQKDLLWTGSDDGLVHVSKDGGKTWTNVTPNITPKFPEFGTIKMIEASRWDPGTAYIVVDCHLLDDMKPYLYKTTDFGKTWRCLSENLPQDIYLHAVREDTVKPELLFLGTERGVAFSTDSGQNWTQLKLNFPTAAVTDLIVKDNDLVLSTNGRSLWIFDDLTPIRTWSPKVADEAAHLMKALPAIRWNYHGPVTGHPQPVGQNPPRGAVLHYYLKNKPKKTLKLEILDAQGSVVQTYKEKKEAKLHGDQEEPEERDEDEEQFAILPTKPGLHRVVWDLSLRGAEKIKKAQVDLGNPAQGFTALPGNYTARLTVDEQVLTTAIEIKPDPRVTVPAQEWAEQYKFAMQVRADLTKLAGTVDQLRSVRSQISSRNGLLADEEKAKDFVTKSKDVIKKLDDLEDRMHNPKAKITYDIFALKGGTKLYSRLAFLYATALDGDGPPTQGMKEVYTEHAQELKACLELWEKFLKDDLAPLNETAKKNDWPVILVPKIKPPGGK
jgi:photosystem II stability/assembly factor-like uncharacterized protein